MTVSQIKNDKYNVFYFRLFTKKKKTLRYLRFFSSSPFCIKVNIHLRRQTAAILTRCRSQKIEDAQCCSIIISVCMFVCQRRLWIGSTEGDRLNWKFILISLAQTQQKASTYNIESLAMLHSLITFPNNLTFAPRYNVHLVFIRVGSLSRIPGKTSIFREYLPGLLMI